MFKLSPLFFPGLRRTFAPVLALLLTYPSYGQDEQTFATPQDAVKALVAAAQKPDMGEIHAIFGPSGHQLVSDDLVQATDERELFLRRLKQKTQLTPNSDTSITVDIGWDRWPFPIPLVKKDDKWFFDSAAGAQELLARRIGMNEMGAIKVCNAYVVAQREYYSKDRLGDGVPAYAQKLRSSEGTHDGLFWKTKDGDELSPLGPFVAQARVEGYQHPAKMMTEETAPYHGYYFEILTSQGKNAPGDAYSYIINGRMLAGYALIAWPAKWGNTGVMTFMVNQTGKVYQQNLGAETDNVARGISAYDPDATWTLVQ